MHWGLASRSGREKKMDRSRLERYRSQNFAMKWAHHEPVAGLSGLVARDVVVRLDRAAAARPSEQGLVVAPFDPMQPGRSYFIRARFLVSSSTSSTLNARDEGGPVGRPVWFETHPGRLDRSRPVPREMVDGLTW